MIVDCLQSVLMEEKEQNAYSLIVDCVKVSSK